MSDHACHSCTMPIETGEYCQYCVDESGQLHSFEETFQRMLQWTRRNDPQLDQKDAEAQVVRFMSERPAWRQHPQVVERRSQLG